MKSDEFFEKLMEDPQYRKEYEKMQPETELVKALLKARRDARLTQAELSEKSGVAQADISKIESGKGNPTLKMIIRLAEAMNSHVELKIIPNS